MPIFTHVAGDPASLSSTSEQLEGPLGRGCSDAADRVARLRLSAQSVWGGEASVKADSALSGLVSSLDVLSTAAREMGAALEAYGSSLRKVQDAMERAREIARAGGLDVTDKLIDGPPPAARVEWTQEGVFNLASPAEELAFNAWLDRMAVYEQAEGVARDAISDLNEASDRLIDHLGDGRARIEEITRLAPRFLPGGAKAVLDGYVDGLVKLHTEAAKDAGLMASLSPKQSKIMHGHLVRQTTELQNAETMEKIARLSRHGGWSVDALTLGVSAVARVQQGQSSSQIALAELGSFSLGASTAAGSVKALEFTRIGRLGGPKGMAAVYAFGFLVGFVTSSRTRDYVDGWYEDEIFWDLLRRTAEAQEQERANG